MIINNRDSKGALFMKKQNDLNTIAAYLGVATHLDFICFRSVAQQNESRWLAAPALCSYLPRIH